MELPLTEVNLNFEKEVISCIYRHSSMEFLQFNSDFLKDLMNTLSSENKTVILLADFNADLLKYDQNTA